MLSKKLRLSEKIFKRDIDQVPTRNGYGEGLVKAGENDQNVVVLCADLAESTRSLYFKEKYTNRFIEVGVAEQVLATVAAGMAVYGKIPFISSYAAFSPGRNWEQIRTSVALNDVPVKIGGAHAGLTVGPDGATHQSLEDIALMRVIPNMVVLVPSDSIETKKAVISAAKTKNPTYIRFAREKTPVFTTDETPFEIGKASVLWDSMQNPKFKSINVVIFSCGPITYEALDAARKLEKAGIGSSVVNIHTIKPIDEQMIIKYAKLAECAVCVEEHQINGGLGSAVSEVLSKNYPIPIEFIGMPDSFGESGKPKELIKKYKMASKDIVSSAKRAVKRKEK